jgi:CHAT domain-containing protein
MELWKQNQSRELLARILIAVEENRAASLRQDRSWRANLPPEYWETLARARRLEIAALAGDPEATAAKQTQTHVRLLELENSVGLFSPEKAERIPPNQTLPYFQRKLRPGEALISFHVGEDESLAWVLTPIQLEVSRLPGRQALAAAVRQLNGAIAAGQDCGQPAARLYEMLFGRFAGVVEKSPDWILSLDGELFDLPFAALRGPGGFIAERHSIRAIPSAFALDAAARTSPGPLVGIGDPIYNAADTRWQGRVEQAAPPARGTTTLELARLAASATEISEVAKAWTSGSSTLLTGRNATRPRIDDALKAHPAAVHFAVHVVPSSQGSDRALIAIGLDARGAPDFYTPEELAARKLGIPLVVLSACNSGGGAVLPGAGRMGLTRAWLISGAQAVVASLWPTPDESGAIFSSMYRNLGANGGPLSARAVAKALRAAQSEMIGAHDWRSQPRYWAAYFLVGRD